MLATGKSPIIAGILGTVWLFGGASTAIADYYYPSAYCAPGYTVHAYDAPVYYERDVYVRPRPYYRNSAYRYPAPVHRPVVYHTRSYYPTRHAVPRHYYPPRRHYVHPVRTHGVRAHYYRPSHSYRSVRHAVPYRSASRSSIGFSFGRSHYGRHSSRHYGGGFSVSFRR